MGGRKTDMCMQLGGAKCLENASDLGNGIYMQTAYAGVMMGTKCL